MLRLLLARAAITLCGAQVLGVSPAGAQPLGVPMGVYDIAVATSMPHLDENLRYATRTERRCLPDLDASAPFWMLREPALAGCSVKPAVDEGEARVYVLACGGGNQATGRIEWDLDAGGGTGQLRVRLGGKNMTFTQHATVRRVARCAE